MFVRVVSIGTPRLSCCLLFTVPLHVCWHIPYISHKKVFFLSGFPTVRSTDSFKKSRRFARCSFCMIKSFFHCSTVFPHITLISHAMRHPFFSAQKFLARGVLFVAQSFFQRMFVQLLMITIYSVTFNGTFNVALCNLCIPRPPARPSFPCTIQLSDNQKNKLSKAH